MSKTVAQIFGTNPVTTILSTDLFYLVNSPYTPGTDAAISGSSLKALFLQPSNNLSDVISASTSRTNLGLAIGSNVEAWSAVLDTVAAGTYTGSASITTLGTITSGIWNGTPVDVPHGGSGNTTFTAFSVICAGTTATGIFQNVSGLGSSGMVLTSNGAGALPTWQANAASGTVTAGLINQLAWYAAAGTTVSGLATANSGVLVTSSTGVPSILAAGTTGQVLQASSAGTPAWSTTTYPPTNAINTIMFASSANVLGVIAAVNGGVLVSNNTGVPSMLANPSAAGKILQSANAAIPAWSTPTYPSASGASGAVLISDGTNYVASTSLWPNTVGTSRKVVISNGTSNVYSTETYAVPGSANNVMVSDGTNWTATATITSLTLVTPALGTPASGTLTNCTGYTVANLTDVAWTDISGSIGLGGFSGSPTVTYAKSKVIGKTIWFSISVTGTSNANTFTVTTMPKTANSAAGGGLGVVSNNGANTITQGWSIAASGTTLTLYNAGSSTGWSTSGTKAAQFQGFYETT